MMESTYRLYSSIQTQCDDELCWLFSSYRIGPNHEGWKNCHALDIQIPVLESTAWVLSSHIFRRCIYSITSVRTEKSDRSCFSLASWVVPNHFRPSNRHQSTLAINRGAHKCHQTSIATWTQTTDQRAHLDMPISPAEIAEYDILLAALDQTRKNNYSTCGSIFRALAYSHPNRSTTVAALTILASEICINFPSEVKYIWKRVLYSDDQKTELLTYLPQLKMEFTKSLISTRSLLRFRIPCVSTQSYLNTESLLTLLTIPVCM